MKKENTSKNKKKVAKVVPDAIVYIKSSFNNTMLSATDLKGGVYCWASTGRVGFKGTKKSTPYAATQAARALIDQMLEAGTQEIKIFVAGVSSGRDAAIRAFSTAGFRVQAVKDITPIPHNGCRPKKPRRV